MGSETTAPEEVPTLDGSPKAISTTFAPCWHFDPPARLRGDEGRETLKRLLTRKEVCSGCRACEVACVARHDGQFGTATARIKVTKVEPVGLDVPNVCRLCRRPACVAACPTEALYRDEAMGVVRVKTGDCIGCSACADECPYGMVMLHPETDLPLICDLCDGDPACVKRCATGAIIYADSDAIACEKRHYCATGEEISYGGAVT